MDAPGITTRQLDGIFHDSVQPETTVVATEERCRLRRKTCGAGSTLGEPKTWSIPVSPSRFMMPPRAVLAVVTIPPTCWVGTEITILTLVRDCIVADDGELIGSPVGQWIRMRQVAHKLLLRWLVTAAPAGPDVPSRCRPLPRLQLHAVKI